MGIVCYVHDVSDVYEYDVLMYQMNMKMQHGLYETVKLFLCSGDVMKLNTYCVL